MLLQFTVLQPKASTKDGQISCTSCAVHGSELVPNLLLHDKMKVSELLKAKSKNGMKELRANVLVQGYALLCVGYPTSDVEVKTQDEDEPDRFSLLQCSWTMFDRFLFAYNLRRTSETFCFPPVFRGDRVKSVKTGKHQR
ncbi:hypothetical protein RIF29_20327 [Crotalaria pallida]|uniref:Uncharacterized protein n=1 Tax=Crotalaria pallida TaxID=3830 RepID=A0AAN9F2Q7_CROPI